MPSMMNELTQLISSDKAAASISFSAFAHFHYIQDLTHHLILQGILKLQLYFPNFIYLTLLTLSTFPLEKQLCILFTELLHG